MITTLDQSLRQLSDEALDELVPPPVDGQEQTCGRCRTWTKWTTGECWNCAKNRQILGVPAPPLDMVSLYNKPSQLRDWMTGYKGRVDESEPFVPEYVDVVKALIARFFYEHGSRLQDRGSIDVITVVPSSSRTGPHPLETLLRELPLTIPVESLLRRGPGELSFNKPSVDGFEPIKPAAPRRVLLVDDVCTTGARINSAAYALEEAGHKLVGQFVVARRVNVTKQSRSFWDEQRIQPFDWIESPLVNGMARYS
jgi:predicted amidophosphoribosyltransferase